MNEPLPVNTVPTGVKRKLKPRGGSRKGIPNKATKALKDMILGALQKAGGEDYLLAQSEDNPSAFLTLIGKVLPTTLAGDPNAPLSGTFTLQFKGVPKG